MEQNDLIDILVLAKKFNSRLTEVLDMTSQMAEAVDRQDQISVQLLVSMRQEPIAHLAEINESVARRLEHMQPADAACVRDMIEGNETAAQGELEQLLAAQSATNQRLLQRVLEMDRRVNHKLAGTDSIYV